MAKKSNRVGAVVPATAIAKSTSTANSTSTLRVTLAIHHMLAAARFSREVGKLEREHAGKSYGEFWPNILHHSVACVLTTVASLEAYANELFSDRTTAFPGYSQELLHNLWETYGKKPALDKFDFALLLLRKPPLKRGVRPCQDIQVLIELRNGLTHFKPEWENEAVKHKALSKDLRSKTKGSPFVPESELLFPRRWATHSCTAWAVRNAIVFAKSFEQLAGLPTKYKAKPADLKP